VVDVAGADHGRAEAADDADRDLLLAEHPGDSLGATEPVLDRQHDRLGADERPHRSRRRLDIVRLRRDHDQVADARLGRVGSRADPDRPVAARPLDAETVRADRLDMLVPAVDCPDLVSRVAENSGVHRSHRTCPDDRDLHWRT